LQEEEKEWSGGAVCGRNRRKTKPQQGSENWLFGDPG